MQVSLHISYLEASLDMYQLAIGIRWECRIEYLSGFSFILWRFAYIYVWYVLYVLAHDYDFCITIIGDRKHETTGRTDRQTEGQTDGKTKSMQLIRVDIRKFENRLYSLNLRESCFDYTYMIWMIETNTETTPKYKYFKSIALKLSFVGLSNCENQKRWKENSNLHFCRAKG